MQNIKDLHKSHSEMVSLPGRQTVALHRKSPFLLRLNWEVQRQSRAQKYAHIRKHNPDT